MTKRYFTNPDLKQDISNLEYDESVWKPRIKDLINTITARQKTGRRDLDGGLYVGACGVAYMLWKASSHLPELNLMDIANTLATSHLASCPPTTAKNGGFLLGNSGVFAVNAAIAKAKGDQNTVNQLLLAFKQLSKHFLPPDPLGVGSDEMLVGRAGYLLGHLWIQQEINETVLSQEEIFSLCKIMVESGRSYSQQVRSPCPLMYQYYNTQYLGAAHGLAGILQALLSFPEFFKYQPDAEKNVKNSVDYLLQLQSSNGNFPCAMDELGENARDPRDELVHWCHGAPGTVYLLARAYLVWKEEKYLSALIKSAEVCWEKGLLRKGPGICHGVAGTGYVFLLLYRITNNKLYLNKAISCANFLYNPEFRQARVPDCPLSLYEGWAGTVCFLLDLLKPDKAAFPFSEVLF